jgi:hypothetical protein
MSVLTRATLRNIPEDGILHSHGSENLSSYNFAPIGQISLISVLGSFTKISVIWFQLKLNRNDCHFTLAEMHLLEYLPLSRIPLNKANGVPWEQRNGHTIVNFTAVNDLNGI